MKIAAILAGIGLLLIGFYLAETSGIDFTAQWNNLVSSVKPGLRTSLIVIAVLLFLFLAFYVFQLYPGSPIPILVGGISIFILAAGYAYDNMNIWQWIFSFGFVSLVLLMIFLRLTGFRLGGDFAGNAVAVLAVAAPIILAMIALVGIILLFFGVPSGIEKAVDSHDGFHYKAGEAYPKRR